MNPVDVSATAESRIKGMIAIRDCVRTLIEYQTEDYPDADIQAEQEKLNGLYDDFSKKYGMINARANNSAFSSDSSYCLLSSLEVLDDEGNFVRKADMFRVLCFQSLKQFIEHRLVLFVILFYIAGPYHFHDHREVLLIRWSFIMEVADKGFQKHRRSLIPEWVLRLTAFGRCVLKEICGKTLNIVITVQIHKRVITMALFHVDKVKNLYVIALFFQKISRIAEQFAFRVENNKTCVVSS